MTDLLRSDHRTMLEVGSKILPDVIAERGWRSLSGYSGKVELTRRRFADYQAALMPGLLIPVHTTDGEDLPIVWRPDTPRTITDAKGKTKTLKYEQAEGSAVRLDCPPRCRPQLLDADTPLWVTEGYKKGDCLASQGLCVLDVPGVWGWRVPKKIDPAQPPLPDWKRVQLADRTVTIVFDSDVTDIHKPNIAQARDCLARFLTQRGAQVRYCTLPPLPTGAKCGVDDYFVMGHSLTDLEALMHSPAAAPQAHAIVIDMETVMTRQIEWLWYPYLALGKLCILDGDPGVGKTLVATQLAANVSRGHPLPDQAGKLTLSCGVPGLVVFIATEDDLEDTVKPRLVKADADCTKVKAFNEWQDGAGKIHTFTLADLPHLEAVLQTYRPRLVYIDAIQSVLGGHVDANRANQLKELLDPLAKLAATYRCAILASRHPAKPGQNNVKLIHRGANSMAIIGTARLGLYAEDHPTEKTKVLLLQSKSNAGAIGRTQIFSKADGRFEWAGVSRITKEDLAGPTHGPDSRGWLEAYFWLEQRLEGGQAWNATDIETEAELQDISPKSLKRAKKALGVVSTQIKGEAHAGWTWRLPSLPPTSPFSSPSTEPTEATEPTESTETSDLKSKTYEDDRGNRSEGSDVSEASEASEASVDRVVTDPDCLPHVNGIVSPCAHSETRTETMEDGSALIRCTACRRVVRVTTGPARRP